MLVILFDGWIILLHETELRVVFDAVYAGYKSYKEFTKCEIYYTGNNKTTIFLRSMHFVMYLIIIKKIIIINNK